MTLWDIPLKQATEITGLSDQISSTVAARLREMGFEQNQLVECIRRTPLNGPIVVKLGGCVYTMEKDIADKIMIAA